MAKVEKSLINKTLRKIKKQGGTIVVGGSGHLKVYTEAGELIVGSKTPGSDCSWRDFIARLRRYGFAV